MNQHLRGTVVLLALVITLTGCATGTTISFTDQSTMITDGPTLVEEWDEFADVAELTPGGRHA